MTRSNPDLIHNLFLKWKERREFHRQPLKGKKAVESCLEYLVGAATLATHICESRYGAFENWDKESPDVKSYSRITFAATMVSIRGDSWIAESLADTAKAVQS